MQPLRYALIGCCLLPMTCACSDDEPAPIDDTPALVVQRVTNGSFENGIESWGLSGDNAAVQVTEGGCEGTHALTLQADGALDVPFLTLRVQAAGNMGKTLHRAFDVCADANQGLETAIALGFDTVLTSGQAATALEGLDLLTQLQLQAQNRITLLEGSGVSPANIPLIRKQTGITAFHMSGKRTVDGGMKFRRKGVPMGLPLADEYQRMYTDAEEVRRAKLALCI